MTTKSTTMLSRRNLLIGASAAGTLASINPSFAKAPKLDSQAPPFYRFNIGAFQATIVSDGPLPLGDPTRGASVALVGYPENGPLRRTPGRLGGTADVLSRDAYGRGPVRRD